MLNRLLWSSTVLSLFLALSGCLSDADSTSGARDQPNSFPPIKGDFTDTSTGDTTNARSLKPNEVRVTVQVPATLAGGDATDSRRNLFVVEPVSLQVLQIGQGLQELGSLSFSRRQDEAGSVILELDSLATIPSDPDYIIKATLADGTVVRGPLSDTDQDIKLNPFSEYLVAVTLDNLSATQIEEIKTCDASNNICLNQLIWPTLVDQVQDFEIDVPSESGLDEAVAFLAQRVDFTDYVASMVDTLLISESRSSGVQVNTASFNTVYFGLELNRSVSATGAQWGVRRMVTGIAEGNGGTAETYPNLVLTSFDVLGLAVNSIAGEVPYGRQTLTHAGEQFNALDWKPNRHATAPGAAIIKDQRYLQSGRTVLQSISQEHGALWGWAPNPHFFNSFMIADAENRPQALLGSYFHAGKAIELKRSASGQYQRLGTLADLAVGAVEINLNQLDSQNKAEPFDLRVFDEDFNAVSFAVKLDEQAGLPLEARARSGDWINQSSASSRATFSEQNSSGWLLARTSTGTAIGPNAETGAVSITLENDADEIYLDADNPTATAYYGRLRISDGESDVGSGAALASGELLAYTFVDKARGQGIRIAAPETQSASPGGCYQLQGFTLGLTEQAGRLAQLNGSSLSFDAATGAAALTLERIQVEHKLAEGSVSDPQRPPVLSLSGGTVTASGDDLEIAFLDPSLHLKGFVTQAGDVLVFAVKGSDSVGLAMGLRETCP